MLATLPDGLSGTRLFAGVERPDRADEARLEPASAASPEFPAKSWLRPIRRHRRSRQLVRPPLHQSAAAKDRRTDRLPGRDATVSCAANSAIAVRGTAARRLPRRAGNDRLVERR